MTLRNKQLLRNTQVVADINALQRRHHRSDANRANLLVIQLAQPSLLARKRLPDRQRRLPAVVRQTNRHLLTPHGPDLQQHLLRRRDANLRTRAQRGDDRSRARDRGNRRRRTDVHLDVRNVGSRPAAQARHMAGVRQPCVWTGHGVWRRRGRCARRHPVLALGVLAAGAVHRGLYCPRGLPARHSGAAIPHIEGVSAAAHRLPRRDAAGCQSGATPPGPQYWWKSAALVPPIDHHIAGAQRCDASAVPVPRILPKMGSRADDPSIPNRAITHRAGRISDELVQHDGVVHGAVLCASIPRSTGRVSRRRRSSPSANGSLDVGRVAGIGDFDACDGVILLAERGVDGIVRAGRRPTLHFGARLARLADIRVPCTTGDRVRLDADNHVGCHDFCNRPPPPGRRHRRQLCLPFHGFHYRHHRCQRRVPEYSDG